jgi:hypothetical protein
VAKKPTEKISDKRMYWRIASAGWIVFLVCFILALFEWYHMTGWKAVIFNGVSLIFSGIFTGLAVRTKEEEPHPEEVSD